MKKIDFWVVAFLVGCVSLAALTAWLTSAVIFAFGSADYQGVVAFIPHWSFSLSTLVLLYRSHAVRRRVDKFLHRLMPF